MKKLIAIAALCAAGLALAEPKVKKHNVKAPYPGVPVTGQPGQIPNVVNAPGALTTQPIFGWDGGSGSAPQVTIFPLLAASYHFVSGGEAVALVGLDGGSVPGVMEEERGQIVSATMPTFTVLNNNFHSAPTCICSITTATSNVVLDQCQGQLDAGVGGPAGDGGPVTTVSVNSKDADGGTFAYDCIGY